MKIPAAVGVPLMVITFAVHVALTPAGKPFAPDTPLLEIPVAPVVVWVMFVKAISLQSVGVDDAAETVLTGVTMMVPVALDVLTQPPVNGIL